MIAGRLASLLRGALVLMLVAGGCSRGQEAPTVTLTRPSARVPFDGTFEWKPVDQATSYSIAVFAPDGSRQFEVRDLTSPGVKLAASLKLPPARYSVQVTAIRDGKTIAESALTPFDIKK